MDIKRRVEIAVLVKYYDNTLFYIRPNDNTWLDERIKEAHTLSRVRKK